MDPLSIAALIGAGTTIISGLMGSSAANSASQAQTAAYDKAIKYQQKVNAQTRKDLAPWMKSGKTALNAYMGELGLSDAAKNGTFKSGFKTTPGYKFQVAEGEKGAVNNLRSLGMGASGAALKALTRFRTGLADQTYQTYLDRLSGQATGGQVQSGTIAANNNSANMANSIIGRGAALGSGAVGGANAWTGALGNFGNNAGSYLGQYNSDWSKIAA